MDVHNQQHLMPGNSAVSDVTGGSPAAKEVCTAGAGAAATATHEEFVAGLLRTRDALLSNGKSPSDSLIKELEAEIQARQLSTAAAVVQRPAASADL